MVAAIHPQDLSLDRARALIMRAIDKAEDIGMRGAIAVVGASGTLVSASRMDRGGAGGMARARSKAWIAATQQIPSLVHLQRMGMVAPPMVSGFVACSPEAVFPGAGGMPIREDGWVVAGMAASGAGIGPFVDYPGADPRKLIADGRPANGEDLLVHYALGLPYEGQHGDDVERWTTAYGAVPDDPGLGMADPPRAGGQLEHAWAMSLANRAIAAARRRELRVAVSVVDRRGEPIQQDVMDGAPSAGAEVSQATAAAAAAFACPSAELTDRDRHGGPAMFDQIAAAVPFAISALPGAVPILEDGVVVAAIGIGGPSPRVCAAVAAEARDGD